MRKIINGIPLTVYCIFFMIGAFFSWCLLTISYKNFVFLGANSIVNLGLMYIFFISINRASEKKDFFNQIEGILRLILIVASILAILLFLKAAIIVEYYIGFQCVLWAIFAFYMLKKYWQSPFENLKNYVYKFLKENRVLFVLVFLLIALSYDECAYQFKWDGLLYYQSCNNVSLFSISSLALYGHISQTYAGIIALLKYMFYDVGIAMIIGNILLFIVAVFSYHGLLMIILPNKKKYFYLVATAMLALSSYYLGMVNYFSLDYCLICLFPLVLYFTFKEKWLYQLLVAVLFCFTKETAIIIYGGLYMGLVMYDFLQLKESNIMSKLKVVINTSHYYTMAIPFVLWLATFLLLGPWNAGDSSILLDGEYIIQKLKVLYLLQFNWIFLVIIILYLIYSLLTKKRIGLNKYIFMITVSQTVFTVFSCILKTINHTRYTDSSVLFLYCTGTYCLCKLLKEKWQTVICVVIGFVVCLSSYKTIDIVSNCIFKYIDIGEDKLLTTVSTPLGDGSIYNKQILWVEKVMNDAIEDAIEDDTIIVVPAIADYSYAFDGVSNLANTEGTFYVQKQYWNHLKNRREVFGGPNNTEYLIYHISDKSNIQIIPNFEKKNISFVYLDSDLGYNFENVLSDTEIIDEKEYCYRGWNLKRVVLEPIGK